MGDKRTKTTNLTREQYNTKSIKATKQATQTELNATPINNCTMNSGPYQNPSKDEHTSSNISFFLTGFGPFGGVVDNPTTVIIQTLKDEASTKIGNSTSVGTIDQDDDFPPADQTEGNSRSSSSSSGASTPITGKEEPLHVKAPNHLHTLHSMEVVHVSASSATKQVQKICSSIQQTFRTQSNIHNNSKNNDTNSSSTQKNSTENESTVHKNTNNITKMTAPCPTKRHVAIIHFGVNPNQRKYNQQSKSGPMFQLEQHAYNEANFRIPDEDGYQPSKQCIEPSLPISHRLSTDLNVGRIKDRLKDKGYEVGLSGDAGRFVCNYIYYQSLSHCLKLQEEMKEVVVVEDDDDGPTSGEEDEIHVLFVHVPPFEDIPSETQVAFTKDLFGCIEEAILAKDKKTRKKRGKKVSSPAAIMKDSITN